MEIERKLTDDNNETRKKDVTGLRLYDDIEIILNFIDTSQISSL